MTRNIVSLPGHASAALALFLALAVGAVAAAGQALPPVVAVTGGKVQGAFLPSPGGAVFKGIPYAAPPVGDLRWRETQPVKPWKGVLQANEYKTGCGTRPAGAGDSAPMAEDCLYLNVWTPAWPAGTKKPVIFWINGGELFGSSGAMRPGVESLVRHGVVLVSFNYRGTLLGMMGHPELTAESPHHSSANYMVFDQVAVLKWIRDNIARFGGDPNNVTAFGQSGGGHAVSMLVTSPMSKGLIHRAIMDSGAPLQATRPYLTLKELELIGQFTADALHAPATNTIKYLRGLPPDQIVGAMPAVRDRLMDTDAIPYDEGTDGYVIPQPPGEVWKAHKEPHVPMIFGNTSFDTAATIRGAAIPAANAPPAVVEAWAKEILQLFYGDNPDLLEAAMKAYGLRGTPNDVSTYPPYGPLQQQLGTDLLHRCGTYYSATLHSAVAPAYAFEFSRISGGRMPTHGAELRFVFGYDDLEDESARQMSDMMQRYWTNFARSGDPNGPGLPPWPRYDAAKKQSVDFTNDGVVQRTGARAMACQPYADKLTRNPTPLTGGAKNVVSNPIPGR